MTKLYSMSFYYHAENPGNCRQILSKTQMTLNKNIPSFLHHFLAQNLFCIWHMKRLEIHGGKLYQKLFTLFWMSFLPLENSVVLNCNHFLCFEPGCQNPIPEDLAMHGT